MDTTLWFLRVTRRARGGSAARNGVGQDCPPPVHGRTVPGDARHHLCGRRFIYKFIYKPVYPMCYIGPGEGAATLPLRTPIHEPMPRRRPAPPRPAIAHARVSEAELAAWQAKAAAAGVSLSELLRQAMARTQTWTAPAREVERERTRQIARIGSNLNQIARWAHTHVDDDLAVVEVLVHLVAIERDLAQLRWRGAGDAG